MKHHPKKSSHPKTGTLLNKRSTSYGQIIFQGHAHLKKREAETNAFFNSAPALNLSPGLWTTFFLILQLSACATQIEVVPEQPLVGPALQPKLRPLDHPHHKFNMGNETLAQQNQSLGFFTQKNATIQPWLTQQYLMSTKKISETQISKQNDKTDDIEQLEQNFLSYDHDLLNLKSDLKKFEHIADELKNAKNSQVIQNEWAVLQRSVISQIFRLNKIFLKQMDEISENFNIPQKRYTAILGNGLILNAHDIETMMIMFVSKLRHFMMENLENVKKFEGVREIFCDGLVIQLQARIKESKMMVDPLFDEIKSTFYKNYEMLLQSLLKEIESDRSGEKVSLGLEQKYLEYTEQVSKLDYDLQFEIMEIVNKLNPYDQARLAKKLQAAHDYSDNFLGAIIVTAIAIIGFPVFNFLKAKKNEYDSIRSEKQKENDLVQLESLRKEISKVSNKINKNSKKMRELENDMSNLSPHHNMLPEDAGSFAGLKLQLKQLTGQYAYFMNLDLELESDLNKIAKQLDDFIRNEYQTFNDSRKEITEKIQSKVNQKNESSSSEIIYLNNNEDKIALLDKKINVLKLKINEFLIPSQILTITSVGERWHAAYIVIERTKNRLCAIKERTVFNRDLHKKWSVFEVKLEHHQKLLNQAYDLKNNITQLDVEMLQEDAATLNQMQLEITYENYDERLALFKEIYNKNSPDDLKVLQKDIGSFESLLNKIKTSEDEIAILAQQMHVDLLKQEVDPESVNKSFRR